MKRVHVVTSFLLRRDDGLDRVLLLRRSQRVGTHRGMWAGVSGYLERDPDEQALLEVREETGLGRGDVELLKRGEAVEAEDRSNDRLWVVHPYLFLVKRPEKVRLDWEHTASRWVAPQALGRYRTVPKLKEALARVYPPPFPPPVEEVLQAIRQDTTHGAGQLARQAAHAMAVAAKGSQATSHQGLLQELRLVALAAAGTRPSMAPLGNIAALILDGVAQAPETAVKDLKALAVQVADGWRRRSDEASAIIAEKAAEVAQGVIVTNSYSSTTIRAPAPQQGANRPGIRRRGPAWVRGPGHGPGAGPGRRADDPGDRRPGAVPSRPGRRRNRWGRRRHRQRGGGEQGRHLRTGAGGPGPSGAPFTCWRIA